LLLGKAAPPFNKGCVGGSGQSGFGPARGLVCPSPPREGLAGEGFNLLKRPKSDVAVVALGTKRGAEAVAAPSTAVCSSSGSGSWRAGLEATVTRCFSRSVAHPAEN